MKLRRKCQDVKHGLSSEKQMEFFEALIINGEEIEFMLNLTRSKFEALNEDLFKKCIQIVHKCLKEGSFTINNIDEVLLVGGSTKIPKVREMLAEVFGKQKLICSINPDEVVAQGAAVAAAMLSLSSQEKTGTTLERVTLMDVTGKSLGVAVKGIEMSVIIPKQSPIPTYGRQSYSTFIPFQSAVQVCVYQGEDEKVANNSFCMDYTVNIENPQARSVFDIKFTLDVDSIVQVELISETSQSLNTKFTAVLNKDLLDKDQIAEAKKRVAGGVQKITSANQQKDMQDMLDKLDALSIKVGHHREHQQLKKDTDNFVKESRALSPPIEEVKKRLESLQKIAATLPEEEEEWFKTPLNLPKE